MKIPVFIVDAFASKPFVGNPAAVCPLNEDNIDNEVLQKIGAEMNLSETAFISPIKESDQRQTDFSTNSHFKIRWFSPTMEIPLCGHATLASAKVLISKFGNTNEVITFQTKTSGSLQVRQDHSNGKLLLVLPNNPPDVNIEESDLGMMALIKTCIGGLKYLEAKFSPYANNCLVIRLEDSWTQSEFEAIQVDPNSLLSVDTQGRVEGIIMTCKAPDTSELDFYSRYFGPWMGVPEDPVTGSAHAVLGPYWQGILKKDRMKARQCSKRGGETGIVMAPDTTTLIAEACLVMDGHLTI